MAFFLLRAAKNALKLCVVAPQTLEQDATPMVQWCETIITQHRNVQSPSPTASAAMTLMMEAMGAVLRRAPTPLAMRNAPLALNGLASASSPTNAGSSSSNNNNNYNSSALLVNRRLFGLCSLLAAANGLALRDPAPLRPLFLLVLDSPVSHARSLPRRTFDRCVCT